MAVHNSQRAAWTHNILGRFSRALRPMVSPRVASTYPRLTVDLLGKPLELSALGVTNVTLLAKGELDNAPL